MAKYICKRIVLAVITIWAVATITFFLMNMVPGGPFLSEKAVSPQALKALEAEYTYCDWLKISLRVKFP